MKKINTDKWIVKKMGEPLNYPNWYCKPYEGSFEQLIDKVYNLLKKHNQEINDGQ